MQKSDKISKNKLAGIFNFAPHYRLPIFQKLAKELDMDLYFGTRLLTDIKPLKYQHLTGFKALLPTKYFRRFYYNSGVFTLLHKRKYDKLIFTGEVKNLSAWLALFMKIFNPKLKVMLWMHGWYGNEKGLDKWVKLFMYRWADHLFLYGNYAKKRLQDEGISNSKMSVVYNSLDTEKQIELRATLQKDIIYEQHFKNDYPTIIYIGRIQKVKRIDWLIKLLAQLEKNDVYANLILIGEGDLRKQLEEEAISSNVAKRVWFYGASYDETELAKLIFNATLCVSPGNVGLTAMHSLVYGCPVITHNNFQKQMPEFEAIEPNKTGDFYSEDDFFDFVVVITRWLEKSKSKEFRDNVSKECLAVISEKYNTKSQIKVLKEVLGDRKTEE